MNNSASQNTSKSRRKPKQDNTTKHFSLNKKHITCGVMKKEWKVGNTLLTYQTPLGSKGHCTPTLSISCNKKLKIKKGKTEKIFFPFCVTSNHSSDNL